MARTRRAPERQRLFTDDSIKGRILSAALSLFAERGIGDVSLRAIGARAGSRNTGAIQYHFGARIDLISALLDHVCERVWQPAEKRLQDAVLDDAPLREVLIRGIWPMKMAPYEFDLGAEATVVLLYCAYDPDPAIRALGSACSAPHLWTFYRAVRRLLQELPDDVFETRWGFFITEALAGQAARLQEFRLTGRLSRLPSWTAHKAYVAALIDFAEGGFLAPVHAPAGLEPLLAPP